MKHILGKLPDVVCILGSEMKIVSRQCYSKVKGAHVPGNEWHVCCKCERE